MAGTGGAPPACPGGCDDANDCTDDSCVSNKCVHQAVAVATACGVGRSCDAQAVCVRCRDTAAGVARDAGCPANAPVCQGTGLDAACVGCTAAADCDDANDCTTEACTAGKCVNAPAAAGQACATGVCNGAVDSEKCVACADTGAPGSKDSGCSVAGKPACDPSGTPACFACVNDADCATDNVACTVETCTNHVCSHVATDSLCLPASGDVCKPNKCDAVQGCKVVDISSSVDLVTADSKTGNGSFELGTKPATDWSEVGAYWLTQNCASPGCAGSTGKTLPSAGQALAWLGGVLDAGIGDLNHLMPLPAGTTKLHILADTNFQTKSATAANHDYLTVRMMDASYMPIGAPLMSKSAADAQTGTAHAWTLNGLNVTVDMSAYAGTDVSISFLSDTDTTLNTDFFIDNVRVTATVCQ